MDYTSIFKERADRYVMASRQWPEIRKEEFSSYLDCLGLHPGEQLLDVPCGLAQVGHLVSPEVGYTGLDPAEDFAVAGGGTGALVVQGNLRCMPFRNHGFDVIGSLTGVHHEVQRTELYAEWLRLLRPGGRLIMMDVWVGSSIDVFLNGFVDRWNSQGHSGHFLQKDDLSALRQVGFDQVVVRQLDYYWRAPSDEEMHAFMLNLFGLDLAPTLPVMQQAWLELGWHKQESGCHLPWSLAVVTASKTGGCSP